MTEPATKFLDFVEGAFNKEALFFSGEDTDDGYAAPSAMVFNDIPDPGYMTCVTYGLSYAQHEKWTQGRKPELIMTINSQDPVWATELIDVVSRLRGDCPFSYGQIVRLGRPVTPTSRMAGFLFFAPAILGPDTYMDIDVGLDYRICLTGAYPVSPEEIDRIGEIGLESFWKQDDFDFMNIHR